MGVRPAFDHEREFVVEVEAWIGSGHSEVCSGEQTHS
jgi:hypothetical protein